MGLKVKISRDESSHVSAKGSDKLLSGCGSLAFLSTQQDKGFRVKWKCDRNEGQWVGGPCGWAMLLLNLLHIPLSLQFTANANDLFRAKLLWWVWSRT